VQSGGGLGYRNDIELVTAMRRMVHDHELRDELADRGYSVRIGEWSESEHINHYLELIAEARATREPSRVPRPHTFDRRPVPTAERAEWQWMARKPGSERD
jgi:hypothetical protein